MVVEFVLMEKLIRGVEFMDFLSDVHEVLSKHYGMY